MDVHAPQVLGGILILIALPTLMFTLVTGKVVQDIAGWPSRHDPADRQQDRRRFHWHVIGQASGVALGLALVLSSTD